MLSLHVPDSLIICTSHVMHGFAPNDTIFFSMQTNNFVSEEIIRMEPDDGLERLADALKICGWFKHLFFEKRAQLSKYFKEEPIVEWDFKSNLIFARMDVFISQMKLIEVATATVLRFILSSVL